MAGKQMVSIQIFNTGAIIDKEAAEKKEVTAETASLDLPRIVFIIFLVGMLGTACIDLSNHSQTGSPLQKIFPNAPFHCHGTFWCGIPKYSKDEIKDLHDSLVYMQQSLSGYVSELRTTTASKERIESELSIAREIQMGMIPKIFPPYPERKRGPNAILILPKK